MALDHLAQHPETIGLDRRKVLTASVEQVLFDRGKLICPVDLVYMVRENKTLKAIIIEYKANGHVMAIERGEGQLKRAVNYYQNNLGIPAEGRLITCSSYPVLKNVKKN